jgi:hypothetical protein
LPTERSRAARRLKTMPGFTVPTIERDAFRVLGGNLQVGLEHRRQRKVRFVELLKCDVSTT